VGRTNPANLEGIFIMSRLLLAAGLVFGVASTVPAWAQRNVPVSPTTMMSHTASMSGWTHVAMKNDVDGANAPRPIAPTMADSASAGM
jgi:hypothetical protein